MKITYKNKLTKKFIKDFEQDQAKYGTEVALYNLLWVQAVTQLKEIGVKGIKTT